VEERKRRKEKGGLEVNVRVRWMEDEGSGGGRKEGKRESSRSYNDGKRR
jgi:hypothetical protein